ncbi:hypothetical protein RB195_017584 [Necator americanus]|uniref:Metalloendopeptidase n=1 Tax=Necator americanus TaxID=51031 RepID=A0ABR1C7G8_NECAM
MWSWILLLVFSYATLAVDDEAIQKATAILVSNSTDSNGTAGPDEDYIKKIAASLELFNIKKSQLSRQGTQSKPFDEKGYRTAVGPRDTNRTAPPEASEHLKAVALEGDMILSPTQINNMLTGTPSRKRRQSQTDPRSMWDPNTPIPYYIDPSLYNTVGLINQAIKFWTDNTCLSFTLSTSAEKHYGMAYDYGSVMQYNPYAFAINYNIPTSVARDVNYQNMMGQRDGPAFSDVKQMNLLYNCAARCRSRPPCQNNGIVNSRTCTTCICPRAFAGNYCNSLRQGTGSACNGQVIQATSSSFASFTATVGNGMSYQYSTTPSECFWTISAPAGRRIQFQIKSLDTNCMEGCNWSGFEVNTGNLDLAGMLVCCSSISSTMFTSLGNMITIRGVSRYNNANMGISYRVV